MEKSFVMQKPDLELEPHFREYPLTEDEIEKSIKRSIDPHFDEELKKLYFIRDNPLWSILNSPYRNVQAFIQKSQILFACLIAFVALLVPEIRENILTRSWGSKTLVFLTEFGSWVMIAHLLGRNRLPINYTSLVIMRLFLAMETKYQSNEQIQTEKSESATGLFNMDKLAQILRSGTVGVESKGSISENVHSTPNPHFLIRNLLLIGLLLSLSYVVTRFTKIRIGKLDSLALMGSFLCSISGTVILISSLAIERIGVERHLMLCKIWANFALLWTFVLALFLFQRLILQQSQKLSLIHSNRMHFESLICFLHVYFVIRFIPVIHTGFLFRSNFANGIPTWKAYVEFFVPGGLRWFLAELIPSSLFIISSVLDKYYLTLPNAMWNY